MHTLATTMTLGNLSSNKSFPKSKTGQTNYQFKETCHVTQKWVF